MIFKGSRFILQGLRVFSITCGELHNSLIFNGEGRVCMRNAERELAVAGQKNAGGRDTA